VFAEYFVFEDLSSILSDSVTKDVYVMYLV